MFQIPEKINVDDKEILPVFVKAIIKGSSVPMSPREPEISAQGAARKVLQLYIVEDGISCPCSCEVQDSDDSI